MESTVLAVISGGSFMGSTVLTKTSTLDNSDGFPSFSYLQPFQRPILFIIEYKQNGLTCIKHIRVGVYGALNT